MTSDTVEEIGSALERVMVDSRKRAKEEALVSLDTVTIFCRIFVIGYRLSEIFRFFGSGNQNYETDGNVRYLSCKIAVICSTILYPSISWVIADASELF